MDTAKLSDKALFSFFRDITGKCALSVSYPVPHHLRPLHSNKHLSGSIETDLNYPCFQVFMSIPMLENAQGQRQAKELIMQIVHDLESTRFFAAFHGIRFELYDGRLGFSQYLESGKRNRSCTKSISNHAISEQEHRNALMCFRAAVAEYDSLRRSFSSIGKRARATDQTQCQGNLDKEQQALGRICDVAALLSSDMARFITWRNAQDVFTKQQRPSLRRSSVSSLDLSKETPKFGFRRVHRTQSAPMFEGLQLARSKSHHRNRSKSMDGIAMPIYSTSEQKKCFATYFQPPKPKLKASDLKQVPSRHTYIRRRAQRLIKPLSARFCAPLMPTSFYSPPSQPWHSVVIVLQSQNLVEDGMFIMRSRKETLSFNGEYSLSDPSEFTMQRVSINLIPNGKTTVPNLGLILGRHLHLLGLSIPSDLPLSMSPNANTDASAWFETSSNVTRPTRSLLSRPMFEEELEDLANSQDSDENMPVTPGSERDGFLSRQDKDEDDNMDIDTEWVHIIRNEDRVLR